MALIRAGCELLLIAYLPGTLIYRLPVLDRQGRAALAAEERAFWGVLLSIVLSSFVGLALAALGAYRFDRLLWINLTLCALILLFVRGRLRFGSTAPPPGWTAFIPLGLVICGLWLNFYVPPAEYIIGGKDPGIYMNEGIRIAQRSALIAADEVARSVPPPFRGLFFRPSTDPSYYSNRFMGFFVLDPAATTVVGQFPHLYPLWIAIAYGVNGLSGAREVVGVWAVLGLLSVYFVGTRLVGRAAALAGAVLLGINVVELWYARYPNAEMLMQPLLFAALLAFTRAEADEDRFFGPVAALLLVLCLFAHLTGVFAVACVGGTALLVSVRGGRARLSFFLPLIFGTTLAAVYLQHYIPPYFDVPLGFIQNLRPIHIALVAVLGLAGAALWFAGRHVPVSTRLRWTLASLTVVLWALAGYAFFFRSAGDVLAVHDADSLRTFTAFYLSWYGLAAALVGFAVVAMSFQEGAALLVTVAAFSFVFFYKIRIVPEHFWAARRFLAVILPGAMLLAGTAAFGSRKNTAPLTRRFGRARLARDLVGFALVLALGWHFWSATRPLLRHVEYAGLIPHLEQLAATVGDDDLMLVEARGASDAHVLALPLAYIYARNVLVLADTDPDKRLFRAFLGWARGRYHRIFFAGGGGGGTELLSREMSVVPIRGERFQVPEYDSPVNAYPQGVRFKEFDLSIYEFLPQPAVAEGFDLDVGAADDIYVRHFYAKEQGPGGSTFRWTRDVSFVSIVGTRPEQQRLTLWMSAGGRPPTAAPPTVQIFLDDRALGTLTVGRAPAQYDLAIPADLAATITRTEEAAQLRLVTSTWNPAQIMHAKDDRDLGVMLDRVRVR
jgi:hypothetical protein